MPVSRRHFLLGSLSLPLFAGKAAPERPNILLILVDELPAWVLGAYGNKEFRTPNLDRLAQTGTRFFRHFSCAPAPGPGCATLLSGRTPMQLGDAPAASPAESPLAKMLAGLGYACQGAAVTAALPLLEQQAAGKPFFLALNHTIGYEGAPQKYLDLYAKEKFDGYNPEHAAANAVQKEMLADVVGNVRKVAAAVSAVDDTVAALVATLRQRSLLDSTLVIFTSACGALLGRHGLWGSSLASQPPNMYDEAVATPMIWSWPGHVPAQGVRPEMVSAYDLVPTLCELLAAAPPAGNLCGRSYGPLVTGKPLPKKHPWRTTVCAHIDDTDMAREERYKLVLRAQGMGPNELYDLSADERENVNQYDNQRYLTVRNTLAGELSKWQQQFSA
ncbi:MAG: sulfatase-like hydrolase/transferase [Acidobacteriia bacterium]|nr:sulfatase-like hydrolase/transferase [Terriglobia bacterium]